MTTHSSTYKDLEGPATKVEGADSVVAAALAKCKERSKAQKPVLKATSCRHEGLEGSPEVHAAQHAAPCRYPDAAGAWQTWLKQYRRRAQEHQSVQEGD